MAAITQALVDKVVLPGDRVGTAEGIDNSDEKVILGPGVREAEKSFVAFKAGILRRRQPSLIWIETNQKRYVPVKDETVIGIIVGKGGESYKVDIGAHITASLGNLSFEGATKRNHPNLQIGDLVYCKLAVAHKDMEPEVVCVDPNGRSNGLGALSGGFMMQTSLGLARKLLSPSCLVLKLLGEALPFEITVGMNGRVWIKSKGLAITTAVANTLDSVEFMDDTQVTQMVRGVVAGLRGF